MRGSVYYQSAELTKAIFAEGAKKEDRTDPSSAYFGCVASYKTMETYRNVWNNLGHYLKEHWGVKDFEALTDEHISAYMAYKIEYYPSKQYLEKLSSALGKLELALKRYTAAKYGTPKEYAFNIRQLHLDNARKLKIVADGYHNRVYDNPALLIQNLSKYEHRLAATIQLEGGARSEAVTLIKQSQLKGYKTDNIAGKEVGVIETKEKGGKVGDVLVSIETYQQLGGYLQNNKQFKINYSACSDDIRQACLRLKIKPEGSHGFRWTFAQNRVREYQKYEYSYEEALQGVSLEMKHFRASITEHYLG
jgi:integrase